MALYEHPKASLIYAYEPAQGYDLGWLCLSPLTLYAASTYWSAMTITSSAARVPRSMSVRSQELLRAVSG